MADWFRTFAPDLWIARTDRRAEADFLRRALRLRRGSRFLDAPCGEGGVSIEIAPHGVRVTGVDLRDGAIRAARRAFRKRGLDGTFAVGDLRDLPFDHEFDAAANWYGSFGYFATEDENRAALAALVRAVRRGGRVLVDQPNRERVLRDFHARVVLPGLTIASRWDAGAERIVSRRKPAGRPASTSSIRVYTPAQFRRLFVSVGLRDLEWHGAWDGRPWGRGSPRTIVVGRRA